MTPKSSTTMNAWRSHANRRKVAIFAAAGMFALAAGIFFAHSVPPTKQVFFTDFSVFWTAARFDDVYNAEAITAAQRWLLPPEPLLRPFVYPPPMLLVLRPLGLLSFTAAVSLWTAIGITCFVASSRLYGKHALLALFSPMVIVSIVIGQASLFLGSAMAGAVALLKDKPVESGLLFGLVGALKPQLALLVPIALICGRHWRTIGASVVAGTIAILLSLTLGAHLWLDWYSSLGGFLKEIHTDSFKSMNVSRGAMFAPIGAFAVAYVWSKSERADLRLVTLVCGTCLSLPYMMNYDFAAIAPAAVALVFRRDCLALLIGFFGLMVLWISPFVVALGASFLVYKVQRWPGS